MKDEELVTRLRDPAHCNDLFLRRLAAKEIQRLSAKFDGISPKQERLAIEFCMEIAGRRGEQPCPPDPVRLLEMAEALYRAEVDQ